jgi:VCBS repeat-containing protein
LTYTADTTSTGGGTVTIDPAIGNFTYTPTQAQRQASDDTTTDTFTITADNGVRTTTRTVTVTVAAPPSTVTERMAVGMNLENVVDWSPAWTFTDVFKASRPWISHSFNPQTWQTTWDPAQAPTLDLDANGNVRSLKTWTHDGVELRQYAGTLMFNGLDGGYAGGTYHAEWDGTGVVTFGNDAVVTSTGTTADGRTFAKLQVTPTDNGIYMRIEETNPADPVRAKLRRPALAARFRVLSVPPAVPGTLSFFRRTALHGHAGDQYLRHHHVGATPGRQRHSTGLRAGGHTQRTGRQRNVAGVHG